MGKRTSDFMALAAILGGAGLGLGLTSLVARTGPVAQVDAASVEVRVVPDRVMARRGSGARTLYLRSRARANGRDWVWVSAARVRVDREAQRRLERDRVDRLRSNVEEAQQKAADLARQQRNMEAEMDRLAEAGNGPGTDAGRRLFERKEAMQEEIADLEREIGRLTRYARSDQREASDRLREAATTISDDKLKERVRYSRGLIGVQDRAFTREFEAETTRIVEELEEELERVSDAIGENQLEELRRVEREIEGFDWEQVQRLRAQMEELRLGARGMADLEALFEALEGVEALEDLDLETLTIDIRRDEEDQRRRRRRRRPGR